MTKKFLMTLSLAGALVLPSMLSSAPSRKECRTAAFTNYKSAKAACRKDKNGKERRACYKSAWAEYKKAKKACPRR